MPSWDRLVDTPDPQSHLVQLYGADDRVLTRNAGRYLWEGLQRGNGLLVMATPEHSKAFTRQIKALGGDPETAVREGRLVCLDAQETLARFMVNGQPEWRQFESTVGTAMQEIAARTDQSELRAYGEMVGVLWRAGQYSAAIRVERFWNTLLKSNRFNLFCAYPIDIFGNEFQVTALDALLCAHTHLLPAGNDGNLETAINRAMDEVLGARADGLRRLMKANFRPSWAVIPRAEASILWLRNNLPREADEIIARSRQNYLSTRGAL
jgi:hypothetical protein